MVTDAAIKNIAKPTQLPKPQLEELVRLRAGLAELVLYDPVYMPIFERFEREIRILETLDPLARARAIVAAQKAID